MIPKKLLRRRWGLQIELKNASVNTLRMVSCDQVNKLGRRTELWLLIAEARNTSICHDEDRGVECTGYHLMYQGAADHQYGQNQ